MTRLATATALLVLLTAQPAFAERDPYARCLRSQMPQAEIPFEPTQSERAFILMHCESLRVEMEEMDNSYEAKGLPSPYTPHKSPVCLPLSTGGTWCVPR